MIFWHLLQCKNFPLFGLLMRFFSNCNFNTRSYGAIITGVRPTLTASSTKKMSQILMNSLLSWIHAVQFFKRMHDNRNVKVSYVTKSYHKIVHSSVMYYQNFNVIHKSNKKLLTIKSVKCSFNI